LKIVGEQPAGMDRHLAINSGEAVRIFTGAPLPDGADAVVMQEDVELAGGEIILQESVAVGEFVRVRGGDVAAGQQVVEKGERITPQKIALLAAQGFRTIEVGSDVRVSVISTGDELSAPERELEAGQIYESNSILIEALSRKSGAKVESVTHCADRADEIEAAVRAAASCDVLIITGGVSVGARDFVKAAITAAGGTLDFWRVRVKPGKPFLFGRVGTCAVFGLPGNPVSAFVTFLLFVRPAILKLRGAGAEELRLPSQSARLAVDVANESDRPHYLRGMLRDGSFRPIGRQESHALFGLSRSDALLLVRPGQALAAADLATVFTWE
ncbi:MAG: gephyrin-like molybdotransferase Glp, partial [Chthoniobacterales bacterium]